MDSVPFLQVETDAVSVTETNFRLQRVNDFAFILPIKNVSIGLSILCLINFNF
jgi:hypothetical protein